MAYIFDLCICGDRFEFKKYNVDDWHVGSRKVEPMFLSLGDQCSEMSSWFEAMRLSCECERESNGHDVEV